MAISPELILAQTAHDISVNRFATTLSSKAIPFLEQSADFAANTLINGWDSVTSKRKLAAIQSLIKRQLSEIYAEMDSILFSEFNDFAMAEMDFTLKATQEVLAPDLIMLPVEDQKLIAAISSEPLLIDEQAIDYDAYVSSVGKKSVERINNFIGFGYAQGLTVQQMVDGIQGTRKQGYKDGLVAKDKINASRVVRTSINHIATQSRLALYKQNDDIVEGYRIIATLDTRTSTICKDLDQTVVMPDDEYQPYPPFHPNCRTTVIAEIKGKSLRDSSATRAANFKKQGDIASGTVGQVSAQTQYYELLKRQSAAQQDLALGKVRGKIFRNAGLTVAEFKESMTNRLNQPLTLAEMARKDERILQYMKDNDFDKYLD